MNSITIITPTTGKPSLDRLVESLDDQQTSAHLFHILLWDDFRDPGAKSPATYDGPNRFSIVAPSGSGRNGAAPGSLLRSIGLMAARSDWVTFADDDVWWDRHHAESLVQCVYGLNWGSSLRKIWSSRGDYFGVDRFESVGDDASRKVPYEMCDNNTMIFRRELGVRAAPLYRETTEYNDDRLMYQFLKQQAGPRGRTNEASINHVCPEKLNEFFRINCSRV